MKFASGRSVSGATVDQEKGVGMDRWEYKIADLTKVEKDIGEVGVRFVECALRGQGRAAVSPPRSRSGTG